jgi:hypothetical protein
LAQQLFSLLPCKLHSFWKHPIHAKISKSSDISNVERHQLRHVDVLQIRKNKAAVTVTTTTTITACMPYAFVISDALGNQDFEDDEGESTFLVTSMIGEWAVFLPIA